MDDIREKVNELGNFILKCIEIERLEVKLCIMGCPKRAYEVFISLLTSVQHSGRTNGIDIQFPSSVYGAHH